MQPDWRGLQLSLEQLARAFHQLVQIDGLKFGRRHAGEITEASDDAAQVGQFGQQRGGALAEHFVELLGMLIAGALEIFHGDLEGEERVLELVGQAAGEFAPGRYALRLNQAIALFGKLPGHLVEGFGQSADLVAGADVHAGAPVPSGHLAGPGGQGAHGRVTRAVAHQLMTTPSRMPPPATRKPMVRRNRSISTCSRRELPSSSAPRRLFSRPERGIAWKVSALAASRDQRTVSTPSLLPARTAWISGASRATSRNPPPGSVMDCGDSPGPRFR